MYTVKGLLDKDGKAAVLVSGKDWHIAREKAAKFRDQGLEVEIWHENGVKVAEPEIASNAQKAPDEKSPDDVLAEAVKAMNAEH